MSNGIINFRAVIVSESSTVPILALGRAIESVGPGHYDDIYVDMGMVSENQFSGIGSTTPPIMFEIRLDNQDAEKVRITLSGIASNVINGVLATTNSTVGIQLRDESGNIWHINEPREYPIYPGPNVFRFSASLIATHSDVLPGNLGAQAAFTLAYQ